MQSEISKRVLNLECADAEKDPRLKNLKDKMTEAAVFQAQYEHFYPQLTIAKMSEQERASFVDDTLKEQGKLNEAGRGIYELRIVAFRDASKAKARVKNCGHNAQVFDTLASKANYDCEDEFNVAHAEYTKEQGLESRGPLLKQGKIVSFLRNAEKAEVAHDSLPMPESFWNELSRNRIQAGKVYVIEVSLGRANYTLVVKVIQVKEYAFTDAQVVNKLYAKCRERLNEIVLDLYKNAKIDDVNQSAKQ